jgi:uncharacterized protein (TIGR03086 family)
VSDAHEHFRNVSAGFTAIVEKVGDDAWELPSPCEGWVARDVVSHLVEWIPAFFFERWPAVAKPIPAVAASPVAAWRALAGAVETALADDDVAQEIADTPMGPMSLEAAVEMICTPDVFFHGWDVARATGMDETLDPDEVHRLYVGMESLGDVLERSGQYGPRVEVPDGSSEQTRLLALIGRRV